MNGRILVSGLVLFSLVFGAVLWWAQTRGWYDEVNDLTSITINGVEVPVTEYRGTDGDSSPLKLRGCFLVGDFKAPEASGVEPLVAPGWFDCFDAEEIANDLLSGTAKAYIADSNERYGFDRVIAVYPDGRAFQWREKNKCGDAVFEGQPAPEGCPEPESK